MIFTIINAETGEGFPFVNVSFSGGGGETADFLGEVDIPNDAWPVQLTSIEIFPRQVNAPPASGFLEVIPTTYELGEAVITPDDLDDKPRKKRSGLLLLAIAAVVVLGGNNKHQKN